MFVRKHVSLSILSMSSCVSSFSQIPGLQASNFCGNTKSRRVTEPMINCRMFLFNLFRLQTVSRSIRFAESLLNIFSAINSAIYTKGWHDKSPLTLTLAFWDIYSLAKLYCSPLNIIFMRIISKIYGLDDKTFFVIFLLDFPFKVALE